VGDRLTDHRNRTQCRGLGYGLRGRQAVKSSGYAGPPASREEGRAISEVEPSLGGATRTQVRGSSLLLLGQVVALTANLATQVLLVRYLTKTDYGAFAYALSIASIGETVSSFGLRRGVSRFVPIYEERGDLARAAGTLVFAFATVLSAGLAVVLVVVGLRGSIAGGVATGTEAAALLAILIVLAPVYALENLLDSAFAIFTRPLAIFLRRYVYVPSIRLVVVALLALQGAGVEFVAVGYVVAGVVGLAVYAALLLRVLRARGLAEPVRARRGVYPVREVLRFTVPLLTNDLVGAAIAGGGTVLLGIIAGAEEVADLRAVMPISLTVTYVLSAFGILFVPLAARLYARGEGAELNRLYWVTAGWTAILSFPVFALAFVFAEPLVRLLFGARYSGSASVLAALVVGHFVTAAFGPNGTVLGIYHRVSYILWTNVLAVAVSLGLSVVSILAFDALGAALASSATLVLLNAVRQVGLGARTEVRPLERSFIGLYVLLAALTLALGGARLGLDPPIGVAVVLVGIATLVAAAYARRHLALTDTFPEIARVPGLGRLLGAGGGS
jgi:O-antigen/teichoic acid export membrane protein